MRNTKRLSPSKHYILTRLTVVALCFSIIVFSLSVFVYRGVLRSLDIFFDFHVFYTAGQLWNEGLDVYDPDIFGSRFDQTVGYSPGNVYFYPPQGTVLFSLLARLPLETAHRVLLGLNLALLVVSLCLMAVILSWYRPIRLLEATLLISFLNTGFGRVNLRNSQWGILVFVFLLATFILARNGQKTWAGLSLAAVTFKPSFLPLYLAYYLLRRSYRLVAACMLASGLFTTLPLLLTQRPLVETMMSWLRALMLQDAPGQVNSPSPSAPWSVFMLHLAPLVYRVFNAQSNVTTAISWLIVLTLCGYTVYLIRRSKPSERGDLLDFGLVSALSLLSIYRRNYDIFLLFPGLLYLYVHTVTMNDKAAQPRWAGLLVIILLLISLPNDLVLRLSYTNPALKDNYLWRVIAPFPAWAGVVVFGTLLGLKARSLAPREHQATLCNQGDSGD